MARKTETIVINDENRDKGKTFIITEMSADKAERWAIRALLALSGSGLKFPAGADSAALAAVAEAGFESLTKLDFFTIEPLLDEMWQCVQFEPSPGVVRPVLDNEIEEVKTRLKLRMAVFKLHVAF